MKNLFKSACALAAKPFRFVRTCWSECPKAEKCSMLLMSAFLNIALGLLLLQGCASTSKGLAREQSLINAGTNVVGIAQQIAPFLPAPISTPLGVILGGVSAALAAWNLHTHRAVSALKQKQSTADIASDFSAQRTLSALQLAKAALAAAEQAAQTGPPPRPGGTPAQGAQPQA